MKLRGKQQDNFVCLGQILKEECTAFTTTVHSVCCDCRKFGALSVDAWSLLYLFILYAPLIKTVHFFY